MIVLDASVLVELLTNGALADSIRRDMAGRDDSCIFPRLLEGEVIGAPSRALPATPVLFTH